jgi:hypothetical protein
MSDWPRLYADYLKSEEWALRRDLVMQRAGGLCEGCRLKTASEVHHLTYEHATQEFLFDLVALCGDCHDRLHGDPTTKPQTPTWKPRLAGPINDSPAARADRQRLAELAAIHRRKWMAMTDQERLAQTERVLSSGEEPPPHDAVPEAMEMEHD